MAGGGTVGYFQLDSGLPRSKSNKWSEQDSNSEPPDWESDVLTTRQSLPPRQLTPVLIFIS